LNFNFKTFLSSLLAAADEIKLKTKALSCDSEQGGRELANTQKSDEKSLK